MNQKSQQGFTILDLTIAAVVMIIIACIALPLYSRAKITANEASAASTMRVISQAQNNVYINTRVYLTLEDLRAKGLIDETVSSGTKSGYNFVMSIDNSVQPAHYLISAKPVVADGLGQTGAKRYGLYETGVLYQDRQNLETHFADSAELHTGSTETVGD